MTLATVASRSAGATHSLTHSLAPQDRIKIAKVDTEKYPALASQWGVQALPTLVLFKEGRMIDRIEGAPNAQQLLQWLQPHLPPSPNASGQEASPSAAA